LHTLTSIGFVEDPSARRFGIAYHLPSGISTRREPLSLYQILSRKHITSDHTSQADPSGPFHPTLEQRYRLAATLASSLFTFLHARWLHKNFNSRSIQFFFDKPSLDARTAASPLPSLERPCVGGFVISRPSEPTEISLPPIGLESASPDEIMYLHPDLQVADPAQRPKYHSAYDIYSLGLMLVEIGFWNILPKIVRRDRDPRKNLLGEDLRLKIIQKCMSELPCWVGVKYTEVTLACLKVKDDEIEGISQDLNSFYWDIVFELYQCLPNSSLSN
jgi:hypothetical protein